MSRRLVSQFVMAVMFLVSVCPFRASAQSIPLAEEDPSRIWLARPYADAIAAAYYANEHAESLRIDLTKLALFNSPDSAKTRFGILTSTFKLRGFVSELAALIKNRKFSLSDVGLLFQKKLNPSLDELSESLRDGQELHLSFDSRELQNTLRSWVLSQPERSVAPHQLMARALALTHGEVVSAWAIAWNVMAANWETAATRNYSELINRFTSQTGERSVWRGGARFIVNSKSREGSSQQGPTLELTFSKRGDEFSFIYHRIGIELFAIVNANLAGSSHVGSMLGRIGALGEYLLFKEAAGIRFERRKRLLNDLLAASSGARIFSITRAQRRDFSSSQADVRKYLRSAPIIFNRRYQMADKRPAQYFRSREDSQFWGEVMSENELEIFFTQLKTNLDWPIHPVLLDSNGDLERLQLGLANYANEGARNQTLNSALKEWVDRSEMPRDIEYTDFSMVMAASAEMTSGLRDVDSYSDIHERLKRSVDKTLAQSKIKMTCESLFVD